MSDLSKSVEVMAQAELARARAKWLEVPQAKRELVLTILTDHSSEAGRMAHKAGTRGLGALEAAYDQCQAAFDAAFAVLDALQFMTQPDPHALVAGEPEPAPEAPPGWKPADDMPPEQAAPETLGEP